MTTNEQISHELRANLNRVITVLRPYAQSSGPFHSRADLETAISLSAVLFGASRARCGQAQMNVANLFERAGLRVGLLFLGDDNPGYTMAALRDFTG
jgi:hypothetical protein